VKLIVTWPVGGKGADWPNLAIPYHLAVHEWCVKHDVPCMIIPGYLDENRNKALLLGRQEGATHVAMLDGDHQHMPDTIARLWQHILDDPSRMVVAGLNVQGGGVNRPMFGIHTKSRRLAMSEWHTPLVKCDWTCLCASIISVKVMDLWPHPWFWYDYDERGRWTTEDINFCDKLYEHHVPVYVDTTLVAPHRTEVWADVDTWKRHGREATEEPCST
jgi:hypothetical protein